MNSRRLVLRGLTYCWRTNIAVVVGVATAVAVLAGALLVGDSVRGSLRDLVVQRLGRTDLTLTSSGFFREQLADDLNAHEAFPADFAATAPMIAVPGVVTVQESGRRAGRVSVYGVDERFWRFHGVSPAAAMGERDGLVSTALARQLDIPPEAALLVRVQRPSDMPLESLQGKKDDLGRTLRTIVRGVVPDASLGEFSLAPQQGDVLAVFVPLARLQEEMEVQARVNTVLVAAQHAARSDAVSRLTSIVRSTATLDDVGLRVRSAQNETTLIAESDSAVIDDQQAAVIERAFMASGLLPHRVFTYLANTIRDGDREIPYSLVSALDLATLPAPPSLAPPTIRPSARPRRSASGGEAEPPNAIVLNHWAADDLRARVGDTISMDYYVWEDPGR